MTENILCSTIYLNLASIIFFLMQNPNYNVGFVAKAVVYYYLDNIGTRMRSIADIHGELFVLVHTFKRNFVYFFQIDCKIVDTNLH